MGAHAFRPKLEVADIFRRHGEAWRTANDDRVNLAQRRVMTAIEICRTATLGGHVERCQDCEHSIIAYNSCRNRHCPKCQGRAAAAWLEARKAELLPVPYFHFVFVLPPAVAAMAYQNQAKLYGLLFKAASETLVSVAGERRPMAYQNQAKLYGLLFKAASETLVSVAGERRHLGAQIGIIAVLHTWGQNLQHHPHAHCVVPGGGISPDGKRWIRCRPGFFLPVRVLSRLFRRLFLEDLTAAFKARALQFFGNLAHLNLAKAFAATLATLRKVEWLVYAKRTFAGRAQLLAYLAQYTHRVAITNSRLLNLDETHVHFRWTSHKRGNRQRNKVMRIEIGEFIRRFLLHILPNGFHRIRHYGLLANGHRAEKLALCRNLVAEPIAPIDCEQHHEDHSGARGYQPSPCPCCGGRLLIVESFDGTLYRPYPVRRLDGL